MFIQKYVYRTNNGEVGKEYRIGEFPVYLKERGPISEISQAQAAIHGAGYIQHHSIHSCQKIMPHPLIWHFHVLIITMDPYLHKDPGLNSDQKHTCQKPDQAFILSYIHLNYYLLSGI